jgi:hypothetical protein
MQTAVEVPQEASCGMYDEQDIDADYNKLELLITELPMPLCMLLMKSGSIRGPMRAE